MRDEKLEDLKQFIGATVSQTEARLRAEIKDIRVDLGAEMASLRQEMQDGFAGVGEAIDELHKEIEIRDRVVDRRLTNLEQAA